MKIDMFHQLFYKIHNYSFILNQIVFLLLLHELYHRLIHLAFLDTTLEILFHHHLSILQI